MFQDILDETAKRPGMIEVTRMPDQHLPLGSHEAFVPKPDRLGPRSRLLGQSPFMVCLALHEPGVVTLGTLAMEDLREHDELGGDLGEPAFELLVLGVRPCGADIVAALIARYEQGQRLLRRKGGIGGDIAIASLQRRGGKKLHRHMLLMHRDRQLDGLLTAYVRLPTALRDTQQEGVQDPEAPLLEWVVKEGLVPGIGPPAFSDLRAPLVIGREQPLDHVVPGMLAAGNRDAPDLLCDGRADLLDRGRKGRRSE